MDQLKEAENLSIKSKTLNDTENKENLNRAINIYKKICMEPNISSKDKYKAIVSFYQHIPSEGIDMITRYRDMTPYYKGETLKFHIKLLVKIGSNTDIDSYERITTATMLYNMSYFEHCFSIFDSLAKDETVKIMYRIEACRFLFASEAVDLKASAQNCLINIIDTNAYPCNYRYEIIAGYISTTGIATVLNSTKLKVPYDEEFVYGLQNIFFYNNQNDPRYRILSGQHILQMDTPIQNDEGIDVLLVDNNEKKAICKEILAIASDIQLDHKIRADAADVIMRLGNIGGNVEFIKAARDIIAELGNDKKGGDLLNSINSFYTNAENVHDEKIHETVNKFIENMLSYKIKNSISFNDAYNQVIALVKSKNFEPKIKFAILKSLNRVSIDTAKFTSKNVSISEIFVHVWIRIVNEEDEKRKTFLEGRLLEELQDMSDTCSSGHSARFVNILSTGDENDSSGITISWETQIVSNMIGRMNAKMKYADNADILVTGMMTDAEEIDRNIYLQFLNQHMPLLRAELYKEFVKAGYIKAKEFDIFFKTGESKIRNVE